MSRFYFKVPFVNVLLSSQPCSLQKSVQGTFQDQDADMEKNLNYEINYKSIYKYLIDFNQNYSKIPLFYF